MIISKTPLRISFFGGGTDLKEYYKNGYGAVVSMAIDKYIWVTVHKRFDSSIRVSYTKTEIVDNIDDLKHDIVRECLKMVGISSGIEITTIGEVPAGTGLGSSSSLTVGLLNALYTYIGVQLSTEELLKKACQIEIDILKSPIGKQDQSAAVYGGINYFRFNSDESIERKSIVLSDTLRNSLESKLMLFYTGMQRDANKILKKQTENTSSKLEILNYMRDQAGEMYDMLLNDIFDERFGKMLHEGWIRKSALTGDISNSTIDLLYKEALTAGAVGGKLLGAGGGGFLLLYSEEENQSEIRQTLRKEQMFVRISKHGSRIVYANE